MDTTYQIIAGVISVGIVLMIAPRVFAMNSGKVLKNIALWVGVFLLVAVAYKTVGPGKDAPLVQQEAQISAPETQQTTESAPQEETKTLREEDGFSPPIE